jgi:hypothetical protein
VKQRKVESKEDWMRRNGHARYYGRLMPEERFRLDPEEIARGDAEESRLVTDSYPRAIQLSVAALMDLRLAIAKLRITAAFRVTLPYLRAVWENGTHHAYHDGHHAGIGKRQAYAFTALHMGGVHGPWYGDRRLHMPSLREG